MLLDNVRVEEESGSWDSAFEEIFGSSGDPFEERKACSGLQHEQGDDLLEDETDNDGWPMGSKSKSASGGEDETYQGTSVRLMELSQIPPWKTKSPRTEMPRSA